MNGVEERIILISFEIWILWLIGLIWTKAILSFFPTILHFKRSYGQWTLIQFEMIEWILNSFVQLWMTDIFQYEFFVIFKSKCSSGESTFEFKPFWLHVFINFRRATDPWHWKKTLIKANWTWNCLEYKKLFEPYFWMIPQK